MHTSQSQFVNKVMFPRCCFEENKDCVFPDVASMLPKILFNCVDPRKVFIFEVFVSEIVWGRTGASHTDGHGKTGAYHKGGRKCVLQPRSSR